MKSFSYLDRQQNIQKMSEEVFDLVIVGGGINGAGIARDAASRGMRVALVEASDFASGTSSRSTKLIHGGIRYLENLEFHLVFEALSERAKLFEIAPHLSHPLRFVLPIYKNSRVGMLKMGLGMFLYDVLSIFEAPELFERLSSKEAIERLPMLDAKDLKGAYVYSDGYMDDDRLVIESLRSANEMGALCANYVKVTKGEWQNEKLSSLICHDEIAQKSFTVRGKHFIGGIGPWTDIFAHNVLHKWKDILRPTKGVHLTVAKSRVQMHEAVVMVSEDQKRIVFGVPRHEMMIFGTTDTDFKGDPGLVHTETEDVRYLLEVVQQYFPGVNLKAEDIIATYAGVRPLVQDGSASEGKTSREHTILQDSQNITIVAGGKYTTYRLMSKQVVDKALQTFSLEDRMRFQKSNTNIAINPEASEEKLLQAQMFVPYWAKKYSMKEEDAAFLATRHGMEAEKILQRKTRLTQSVWELEALHAIENTMCMNLRDFYLRRAPLFLAQPDHGLDCLEVLSQSFQPVAEKTGLSLEKQRDDLYQHIKIELGWKKDFLL